MAPPFNEAQMEYLEKGWQFRFDNEPYFSNRAAHESGRPRAQAKTPRQLGLLEASFAADHYPTTTQMIILTHQTGGLRPKPVKDWFESQRRKLERNGGLLFTKRDRVGMDEAGGAARAARMWRRYGKEGGRYAMDLWLGRMGGGRRRSGSGNGVRVRVRVRVKRGEEVRVSITSRKRSKPKVQGIPRWLLEGPEGRAG
ncbi:Uu.00g116920.m01.CDS01 [Anthostomella pinea]|uniref:Uu.00g116920.m01.CDS01 n=1 Tax=Anthostomella pinea TaxID=933095 RepID=A0AAI8VG08_9PEZI|nr:Uu.00g116920.m01.CDS01 [Anthostomella pinea]